MMEILSTKKLLKKIFQSKKNMKNINEKIQIQNQFPFKLLMSLIYNNIVYLKLIDAQEFLIKRENKHQKCSIQKIRKKTTEI